MDVNTPSHFSRVAAVLLVAWLALGTDPLVATTTQNTIVETPTRETLCNFIASLYRGFNGFGCLVESPVSEPDVCYTPTNALAEYVLRTVCGRADLADSVRAFLEEYKAGFYDYYQVLLGKNITLPFRSVHHVEAGRVNGLRVVHVVEGEHVLEDYYEYANLVAIKAIYHLMRGELEDALAELSNLKAMFDNGGFRDKYYMVHGKYEVYKLALATVAFKLANMSSEAELYANTILKVKPLTTLYEPGFRGTGDLNLETASLVALALYGNLRDTVDPVAERDTPVEQFPQIFKAVALVSGLLAVTLVLVYYSRRKLGVKAGSG